MTRSVCAKHLHGTTYHCIWAHPIEFMPDLKTLLTLRYAVAKTGSMRTMGYSVDCTVLPQLVPKFSFGPQAGFYFKKKKFKKKNHSSKKSVKWRYQPGRQGITVYSQQRPLLTREARGCEAYIASAVFLPALPTGISVSYLSPIYTVSTRVHELVASSAICHAEAERKSEILLQQINWGR